MELLRAGSECFTNNGARVTIGGRIRDYSDKQPFVWAIGGNWYHERTGQFVSCDRKFNLVLLPIDSWKSIRRYLCETCGGTGLHPDSTVVKFKKCDHCEGEGYLGFVNGQ